jgi:hypothetical protein
MMKHFLRVVGLGLGIWLLSLLWLDINRILMWPLFAGLIAGMVPAYLFGRIFNRRNRSSVTRAVRPPRFTTISARSDLSTLPTRPSPMIPRRKRASNPTRPMPAL